MPDSHQVQNHLAEARKRKGIGAAQLATQVGVSRQTIYAIESGAYVPNTLVSLQLARILDTTVEQLFEFTPAQNFDGEITEVTFLGEVSGLKPGQPLRLCSVGTHIVAVVPDETSWGIAPADAVLLAPLAKTKSTPNARVRILGDKWRNSARILLAGCDPSVSFLVQALQAQGCELIVAYENSTRALEILRAGFAHVAGTHLVRGSEGHTELAPITKDFPRNSIAVIAYADWEEGFIVANGNPKRIFDVADLARAGVRFVNREPGAGCRHLLDDLLRSEHIAQSRINGYKQVASGHLQAARLVRSGQADCCISTSAVAQALALSFVPLARKPYQLVLRRALLQDPSIQLLLQTLGRASFRREVEVCTGYSMTAAGDRLL
ncbi:MAG: helix-turn-helix domain-containing protein [Acidobacteriota bacterium]|nr:helix-turn-helix domain-containing protein [Acidobacteriota bacterium]